MVIGFVYSLRCIWLPPTFHMVTASIACGDSLRSTRLQVSDGSTPFSVGNLTVEEDDNGNASTKTESVAVTPVVHVCGNGVRSSAEACDDNNTVGIASHTPAKPRPQP